MFHPHPHTHTLASSLEKKSCSLCRTDDCAAFAAAAIIVVVIVTNSKCRHFTPNTLEISFSSPETNSICRNKYIVNRCAYFTFVYYEQTISSDSIRFPLFGPCFRPARAYVHYVHVRTNQSAHHKHCVCVCTEIDTYLSITFSSFETFEHGKKAHAKRAPRTDQRKKKM